MATQDKPMPAHEKAMRDAMVKAARSMPHKGVHPGAMKHPTPGGKT